MKPPLAEAPWLVENPAGWKRSRIRNVAFLSPTYSSSKPKPEDAVTVVPMEKVSETGCIDLSNQYPSIDVSGGLTLFEEGDVIFAKITPCMENGKGAYIPKMPTRYAFGSTEFHGCDLRNAHGFEREEVYAKRGVLPENVGSHTNSSGKERLSWMVRLQQGVWFVQFRKPPFSAG